MLRKNISCFLLFFACVTLLIFTVLYFKIVEPSLENIKNDYIQEKRQEYFQEKYVKFIEENIKYKDYEVDVAFLGDSLTDMYDLDYYYPDIVTVNRGISSSTTFDIEEALKISVLDLKPKVLVFLAGGNNFDTMLNNYEDILSSFKTNLPNTRVVIISLTAMNLEWGKNNYKAINNNIYIKDLAKKYNFTFVDMFTPLYNPTTQEAYSNYTIDGAHLTKDGYDLFTSVLSPVIYQELQLWNKKNE